jgi:hypothetical protein
VLAASPPFELQALALQ